MSERVEIYLATKKSVATPENAEIWQKLEQFFVKRLWHQLTVELCKVLRDEEFTKSLDTHEFYENFVRDFEHRINPLQLVEISIPISKYILTNKDKETAYEFLRKIERTISRDKVSVARIATGLIELRLMNKDSAGSCVDIQIIRKLIEDTQEKIDELVGVTPVHAPFYKVSSIYLKEIGDYAAYYHEALRYLGCEDENNLSQKEKQLQAVLLGFAAMLGDGVYNFGELLAHPILKALDGKQEKWIINVLYAFNCGDLRMFRKYKPQWSQWNDLLKHESFLEEKIRLLSVMEIAWARPSKERFIHFNEIAERTEIELDKVELLVMKALSKNLVRGSIDQVKQLVSISWVQPRVLSMIQIQSMNGRIGSWCAEVETMQKLVRDNAEEILLSV